jgi:RecB family exonuclease
MHGLALVPPLEVREKGARFVDRFNQAAALHNGEAQNAPPVADTVHTQAGIPTVAAERLASLDPTAILSPSTLSTFLDCEARWYYRKVLELPEQRGAALGLGSAVHETIAENYRQKIETKRDLPTEGAVAVFMDAFTRQLDEIELDKTDNADDLRSTGEVITRVYMEQVAPRVEPAAVELHVAGLIGDVAVQGYIDVIDVNGDVIDLKTASKKPSGISPGYRAQVATYAMLAPGASGRARLDTLTKTRTVQHVSQTLQIAESDRKYATRLYSIAQEKMRTGLVAPNRNSNLCSRKYCAHWSRCVEEYGGEVRP